MQLNKETRVNFPSADDIPGFPRHTPGMIFAHPLQVVWIVSASFKLASVPRPKAFALRAKHLIASFGFVHKNLAIGARFCIIFEKGNRSDSVRMANMIRIIACSLKFPAMSTSVLVASGAFPSGRYEAIAFGISTAMNELMGVVNVGVGRVVLLQLSFCNDEIIFEGNECLDLCMNVLDLMVNVSDELVMSDGSLSGRKHGLFLCEENVLLMLGELASEERLSETEVLKHGMSELSAAEHALGNRHIIPTEESLVA